jgi:hypothetical protein
MYSHPLLEEENRDSSNRNSSIMAENEKFLLRIP